MKLRKWMLAANVLLVALTIWIAAKIVLSWSLPEKAKSPHSIHNEEPVQQDNARDKPRRLNEYREIASRDFFKLTRGVANTSRELSQPGKGGKGAGSGLTLTGTMVGENHESYAVITIGEKGTQEIFYLNESVVGARITKIMKDRVFLSIDGREAVLELDYDQSIPGTPGKKSPAIRKAPVRRR
jgi:type II secretory pathway component PulC